MKRLTSMLLVLALLLTLLALPAAQADTAYATAVVKGGWLRLRAEASYDAKTVSAYFTGTRVTILGGSGSWYYVAAPDGNIGYMHADYLTVTGSITGGQLEENRPAYVTSKNGLSVRLRSGPSKQYSTIASYKVGTQVTVLISGDDWCKVRINGRTGYMMTEFLSTEAPDTPSKPSSGYTAYVTSKNGLGVRLRSGASKLYSTLATYNVGTQVTVLEYGATWSKVRVGTLTGYMMTEFLTTEAPATVKRVTISATTVWAGDTLTATVYPAGASVSYRWFNDSNVTLGTDSRYTVTAADAGDRIRVIAQGTNGGYAVSDWATVKGSGYVSNVYRLTGLTISDATPVVGQTLTATVKPAGATANIRWFREDGVYVATGSTYTVHSTDRGVKLYAVADGTGNTSGSVTSKMTSAVTGGTAATPTPTPNLLRVEGVELDDLTPTVGQKLTATVDPFNAMTVITWYRDDDKVLGYGDTYTVQADDAGHTLYVWAEGVNGTFGSATSRITEAVEPLVSLIGPGY